MKTTIVAGAVLALLTLTACGQSADQSGSAPSTSGQSSTVTPAPTTETLPPQSSAPTKPGPPPASVPPPEGIAPQFLELPATQVDAKALPKEFKDRRVWSATDGKTLQLIGLANDSCSNVEGVVEEFSATTVRVVLRPMAQPQGGPDAQVCAQVVTAKATTVALREPLGKRTVVVSAG